MLRSGFIVALMATLITAGLYQYQVVASVCPVPLEYRLGQFDEGFDITHDEAKLALLEAESVWEEATGRNLFTYDENAEFLVNFIFDERQASAIAEERYRDALDAAADRNVELSSEYTELVAEYERVRSNYEAAASAYEARLERHNQVVADYNASGGAPEEVFAELNAEQSALETEREGLNQTTARLNDLVDQINALGEQGNELVDEYNQNVNQYNDQFGTGEAFTQGDYQGDSINIYTFKDMNELKTVLAHELGHALSLDHVEGAESIMYYLMGEQPTNLTLSHTDLAEYQQVCVAEKRLFGFIQL